MSNSRFSGRTEYQTLEEMKRRAKIERTFHRTGSKSSYARSTVGPSSQGSYSRLGMTNGHSPDPRRLSQASSLARSSFSTSAPNAHSSKAKSTSQGYTLVDSSTAATGTLSSGYLNDSGNALMNGKLEHSNSSTSGKFVNGGSLAPSSSHHGRMNGRSNSGSSHGLMNGTLSKKETTFGAAVPSGNDGVISSSSGAKLANGSSPGSGNSPSHLISPSTRHHPMIDDDDITENCYEIPHGTSGTHPAQSSSNPPPVNPTALMNGYLGGAQNQRASFIRSNGLASSAASGGTLSATGGASHALRKSVNSRQPHSGASSPSVAMTTAVASSIGGVSTATTTVPAIHNGHYSFSSIAMATPASSSAASSSHHSSPLLMNGKGSPPTLMNGRSSTTTSSIPNSHPHHRGTAAAAASHRAVMNGYDSNRNSPATVIAQPPPPTTGGPSVPNGSVVKDKPPPLATISNGFTSSGDEGLVAIRIKPDSEGRFGFNVKGGTDQNFPIIVSRVAPGSPADQCYPRLNEGDQVLFINGRDVATHTHDQVVRFIRSARESHSGELVLTVRPNVYVGEDEPEFQYVPETPHVAECVPRSDLLHQSLLLLRDSLASGAAIAQFEQLYRKKPGMTMNVCRQPENLHKNRYRDIAPYDTTRVIITNGLNGDYVNANFVNMEIPTSGIVNRYIAAQGPLPHTTNDFWQVVWEQLCSTVVMLTAAIERGRIKCHQYWPSDGETQDYNNLQVKCLNERQGPSCILRDFLIKNKDTQEERQVSQMQYVDWPDHGVPNDSKQFVNFVEQVRRSRCGTVDPILVHCSAGIGRTGVLILMETAMCMIEANEPVYPLEVVRAMRDQRAMLIQTASQYKFVCEAVLKVYNEGGVKPLAEYLPPR